MSAIPEPLPKRGETVKIALARGAALATVESCRTGSGAHLLSQPARRPHKVYEASEFGKLPREKLRGRHGRSASPAGTVRACAAPRAQLA
jgi:hypothetical protein